MPTVPRTPGCTARRHQDLRDTRARTGEVVSSAGGHDRTVRIGGRYRLRRYRLRAADAAREYLAGHGVDDGGADGRAPPPRKDGEHDIGLPVVDIAGEHGVPPAKFAPDVGGLGAGQELGVTAPGPARAQRGERARPGQRAPFAGLAVTEPDQSLAKLGGQGGEPDDLGAERRDKQPRAERPVRRAWNEAVPAQPDPGAAQGGGRRDGEESGPSDG